MLKFFKKMEKIEEKSYFDFPAAEKKKIINRAAEEANEMQTDLLKKYQKLTTT